MSQKTTPKDAEIKAAVDWWAEQLAGPQLMDNGDVLQSALGTITATTIKHVNQFQINSFKECLTTLLKEMLDRAEERGAWIPEKPDWGSAMRSVHVDYGPDPVLSRAALEAGIGSHMLRFPWKTCMWINPGQVRVAKGYQARAITIYGTPEPGERP